ncbi:LOW QUALITY PROTEIN: RAC-beta serine/threonine-protein kinase B-like [Copidosoma floridanum]|uniref:LOW QUALITY PROTEIN: RAC-beta serine/threonine-protein kinase B-like n=1 Tax=Copidosoma floridanum TaxID=29053 RepID=UPI000C6F95FD|nr:LOW QUALITY PROTEIN: RAC-beta serine/threonine-protein kinase B-like [Copidosoma floridanum]
MDIVKEGWIRKRGKIIRNWRLRYFILKDDGTWLGYKNKPDGQTVGDIPPSNKYTVRECVIRFNKEVKHFTFAVEGLLWPRVVERKFNVNTEKERKDWISAIMYVARKLDNENTYTVQQQLPQMPTESVNTRLNPFEVASTSRKCFDELSSRLENTSISTSTKQKKVTIDNFELLEVLGQGGYGTVISCREKSTKKYYALKTIEKLFIIRHKKVSHTLSENQILKTIRHPFIISLKYSFQTVDRLYFVMDYLSGGDLHFHVHRIGLFDENCAKFYGAEITLAVGHLHSKGIIHRDLKLSNILLDKDGHIKIVDFGLCKEGITYGKTTKTFCGTPEYLAPEVFENDEYTRAVDWWSFGVVMYRMMCGRLPFYDDNQKILSEMIREKKVTYPKHLSVEAENLLKELLIKDPCIRLGGGPFDSDEVVYHSFFDSINWYDLFDKKIPPPFKPQLTLETDTRYFDKRFTDRRVTLTPTDLSYRDRELLIRENKHFTDFSYEESHSSSISSNYYRK